MKLSARLLLACTLTVTSLTAMAQSYPSRPIKVVVPLAAGSLTDVMMRNMAPRMSAALGVPLVIENMPGAGAVVGTATGGKAPADGYTLVMGTSAGFSASPHMQKSLPYNPLKDFTGVCKFGGGAYVLAVNPSIGVKTVAELIAKTKATPLSVASAGLGSTPHMAQEMFKARMGTPFVHVPYKGAPQAIADTVAGHTQVVFETPGPLLSNIRTGKLIPIGIMSARRSATLPEVPTFEELGFPGVRLQGWVGLVLQAGAPQAVIDRVAQACQSALTAPDVVAQALSTGFDIDYVAPAEFTSFIAAEHERWGQLIRQAGIKPE